MGSKIHSANERMTAATALAVMLLGASVLAASNHSSEGPLNYWQTPMDSFKNAGELIGRAKYDAAETELSSDATNFPAPYNSMAIERLEKLDAALKISNAKDTNRIAQLMDLCTELRASDAALQIQLEEKRKKKAPDDSDPESAWRLWETGNTEAALADYKRKLEAEPLDTWQNYWSEQIHLMELSRTNHNKVAFTTELVRQHYLKGFEMPPDYFSSLQELTLAMPYARNENDKAALDLLIIKTLNSMGDEAGRDAWEDKVLGNFKTNDEACARVYLDRGMRLYNKQDFAGALSLLRKIASDYPDTQAYGDAQYTVALILQQQQNYDEAIREYARLFRSKVQDYAKPVDNDEDYKCYRFRAALGISGCYEEKGDYLHALEYVELARDRYKYLSWCKTCMTEMTQTIKARVMLLEDKIKTGGSVASGDTSDTK